MLADLAPQFAFEYDDTTAGTANINTIIVGIQVTASASTNTKGSYAQIVSATDRDWYGFWLQLNGGTSPSGVNSASLMDFAIGPAANESVVLPNMLCGNRLSSTGATSNPAVYIPLYIPKGVRVSARMQSATASRINRVMMWAESGASAPRPIFTKCDVYGVDTSNSTGTNITTSASANTFGSWVNVGATTTRDYKAFGIGFQGKNVSTLSTRSYILEGGFGSTAFMRAVLNTSTAESVITNVSAQVVTQNIPAGTQLQARASTDAAANTETPQVAFYCFY